MRSKEFSHLLVSAVFIPLVAVQSTGTPAHPQPQSGKSRMPVIAAAAAVRPSDSLVAHRNISYVDAPTSSKQYLDLYLPKSSQGKLRPLVVWIHGGGWEIGDKKWGPFQALIDAGFGIASINYRLSDEAAFPAQIHDCKAAIRWLRANAARYGIDSNRIGVWGSSAGGHLASLLGTSAHNRDLEGDLGNPTQSSAVQAVCDWFGPSYFTNETDTQVTDHPLVRKLLAASGDELVKKAVQASPVRQIKGATPPFLIMHGQIDALVPIEQSETLYKALLANGGKATLVKVPGAGHSFLMGGLAEQEKVVEFFRTNL